MLLVKEPMAKDKRRWREMRNLKIIVCLLIFLFTFSGYVFGFTTNNTTITRSFDKSEAPVGQSIAVTVTFTNSEAASLRGFYYAEQVPQGLVVNTTSVKIDGSAIFNYVFESGSVGDVYTGNVVYRWILETPAAFSENNPISSGSAVEIIYSLSLSQAGTFHLDEFSWVGYYQGGSRAAFGHSEDTDKGTIAFSFLDVSFGYWAYDYVMAILDNEITAGCAAGAYCPSNPVTREQMAAFIVRAVEGGQLFEGACTGPSPFSDVLQTSPFCRNIERLVALEITAGCGLDTYCPTNNVTREQMAAFIVRAVEGGQLFEGACDVSSPFTDVLVTSPFCKNIDRLVFLGITQGCATGMYCPANNVLRDQMAAFLARAFLQMQ
jgi:hypothetical protein